VKGESEDETYPDAAAAAVAVAAGRGKRSATWRRDSTTSKRTAWVWRVMRAMLLLRVRRSLTTGHTADRRADVSSLALGLQVDQHKMS